jgi:hypothetical protein
MVSNASAFAGGTGTSANPYQISNVTQLQAVQSRLSAHYILINDIDASITSTWNSGVGFVPITTFTGSFDGQDFVISDLYINSPLTNNVGLFGLVGSGSVVKNVSVVNVQITGQGDVGGIVGYAINNPPVTSCYFNDVWRMEGYPVLSPNDDFYLYPGNITIERTTPSLLHSLTLDMYKYRAYSYQIIVSSDPTYTEVVYSVNTIANYPMSNHTRTISLNAGEYWLTVNALDSAGNTIETLTREFEISQTFNLGTTSASGAVFELVSSIQTPVNGVILTAYNDTWSATYTTSPNGYYQFTELEAGGTYYITASKNGYVTGTLNIVTPSAGQTVTRNIIMQNESAPTYIMPHYVRFTIMSMLGGVFDNVNIAVFEGDSAVPIFTQVTGGDGAVGFELSENIPYRLIIKSEEHGIDTVYKVTPTKSEYNIYVSLASNNTNQADAGMVLYGMHVNGNELNVTWNDTSRLTSLVEVTIKNRDRSMAYYLNSTDSEGYLLQTVNASENITYIVELKVHSGGLPETGIRTHMITFTDGIRPAFDPGFSAPWQSSFLASLSLIFLAVIFGSVNAYIGAMLVSLAGLFHVFVTGWIPASMVTIGMMFIAVIMSVFFYMREAESIK